MFQAPGLCMFTSSLKFYIASMVHAPSHTLGAVTQPQWLCRFYLLQLFSPLYGSITVLMCQDSSLPWAHQVWLHCDSDSMAMFISALISSSGQEEWWRRILLFALFTLPVHSHRCTMMWGCSHSQLSFPFLLSEHPDGVRLHLLSVSQSQLHNCTEVQWPSSLRLSCALSMHTTIVMLWGYPFSHLVLLSTSTTALMMTSSTLFMSPTQEQHYSGTLHMLLLSQHIPHHSSGATAFLLLVPSHNSFMLYHWTHGGSGSPFCPIHRSCPVTTQSWWDPPILFVHVPTELLR